MKSLLIMLPLMLTLSASAQPGPDTLWTRTYGWIGDDTAFSLDRTADGGFIIAGTATFVGPPAQTDMCLVKTDSVGVMQGVRIYGDARDQGAYSVTVASQGGYALAGYTTSAIGQKRSYVVRVNVFGDTLGTGTFPAMSDTFHTACGFCIIERPDHQFNVADLLRFEGDYEQAFFGIFDSMGRETGYSDGNHDGYHMRVHRIREASGGGLLMVGQRSELPATPIGAFLFRNSPYFFCSYGGPPYDDEVFDVAETDNGYLLAGSTNDGQYDGIFLCRTDASGGEVWLGRRITEYGQWATTIIPAMGGGYVLAGTCGTYWGDTDMLLMKISDSGDLIWQRSYGMAGDEEAYDVVQTADGGFVLCGYSNSLQGVGAEWYIVKTLPDPTLGTPEPERPSPDGFSLSAYPNPFNPSTEIRYDLPMAGHVSLRVFDLLGREVSVLKDGFVEAGSHHVTFVGGAFASGIYFARLDAKGFSQTKKLMLLK